MANTNDVMSRCLFLHLLGVVWIVAVALFSFHRSNESSISQLLNLQNIILQIVLCFINCYLSDKVSEHSLKIGDELYHINWPRMNTPEKKVVIFMISRGQKEFRVTCLGMFDCSLITFSRVRSTQRSIILVFN